MKLARLGAAVLQWACCVFLILMIWVLIVDPNVSHVFVASPSETISQLRQWIDAGSLSDMIIHTLLEGCAGLGAGLAIGVTLGVAAVLLPEQLGKVIEPMVAAMYAMPKYALLPLIFLWLGNGYGAVAGFVCINIFPIFFLSSVTGFRSVDESIMRMMSMLGASNRQIATKILLRSAAGYVASAGSFAAAHSITTAIGGEMVLGASAGIGMALDYGTQTINPSAVIAALLIGTVVASVVKLVAERVGAVWTV